jgi:taurine--2-oxoglutarate transaminase
MVAMASRGTGPGHPQREQMAVSLDGAKALHLRRVLTPWSAQAALNPPVIVRAEGVAMYGDDGTRYVDASSGLIAVNLGHNHPRVVEAIREQAGRVTFVPPSFFNDRRAELADKLVGIAPWDEGGRVLFSTSGSEANEDAIKLARAVTGRPKVLTQYRSFHGSSYGSSALTGENRRWASEPSIPGVVRFFAPYPYRSPFQTHDPGDEMRRALDHLRDVLMYEDGSRVAALLIETVVGSNGVIVYPPGYLAGLRAICDEFGILLIFDEVMAGFGRVGAAFGGERFGVIPDLITFAKGVTSGAVPLGGVIVRESIAQYFDKNVMWAGYTYSGHPLAMAAGCAAIDAYLDEGLFARGLAMEDTLVKLLGELKLKHEIVGDVRGAGAFFAIEFVKNRDSNAPLVAWHAKDLGPMPVLFAGLRKRGVYAFGRYNVVHIAPPLIATDADLAEIAAALDGAIGELAAAAAAAG